MDRILFRDYDPVRTKEFPIRYNTSKLGTKIHDPSNPFLCRLKLDSRCYSYEVAEYVDKFWIIAPIYAYYQSLQPVMYRHHLNFKAYMESFGLKFCNLEAIRPEKNQKYLVTKPGNEPFDIQLETSEEFYQRENYLNVAIKMINKTQDWEYVAWIDAHQIFEDNYWWEAAIVKMEKYASVQLFHRIVRWNYHNQTERIWLGAIYKSLLTSKLRDVAGESFYYGNAMSISRDFYHQIGYILDTCIASCCDCLYVLAAMDEKTEIPPLARWSAYVQRFTPWIKNAQKVFKGKRVTQRGDLLHMEHESFFSYYEALDVLNNTDFDVERDLVRAEDGKISIKNETIKEVFHRLQPIEKITRIVMKWVFVGVIVLVVLYITRDRWFYNLRKLFHKKELKD